MWSSKPHRPVDMNRTTPIITLRNARQGGNTVITGFSTGGTYVHFGNSIRQRRLVEDQKEGAGNASILAKGRYFSTKNPVSFADTGFFHLQLFITPYNIAANLSISLSFQEGGSCLKR